MHSFKILNYLIKDSNIIDYFILYVELYMKNHNDF